MRVTCWAKKGSNERGSDDEQTLAIHPAISTEIHQFKFVSNGFLTESSDDHG